MSVRYKIFLFSNCFYSLGSTWFLTDGFMIPKVRLWKHFKIKQGNFYFHLSDLFNACTKIRMMPYNAVRQRFNNKFYTLLDG